MDAPIYDDKRLKVYKLLPEFWGEGVDDIIRIDVSAGTDMEAIAALKKLGLYTKEIQSIFENNA